MAFTGVPTVETITGRLVRITGLSLALGASGTIGLFGDATADVQLPDDFEPVAYGDVDLVDGIWLTYVSVDAAGGGPPDIAVTKAEGPFQVTLANNDGANQTNGLEIYVHWH